MSNSQSAAAKKSGSPGKNRSRRRLAWFSRTNQPEKKYVTPLGSALVGLYLVTVAVFLAQNIFALWPPDREAAEESEVRPVLTSSDEDERAPGGGQGAEGEVQGEGGVEGGAPQQAVSPPSEGALPSLDSLRSRIVELEAQLDGFAPSVDTRPDSLSLGWLWLERPMTRVTWGGRLVLLALMFGALGSWLHASSSFVRFLGNRDFVTSWTWWYLFRPFLGAGLAVLVYVGLRAGFVSVSGEGGQLSHFSVAAVSGLVGLFTEKATKKLAEVFDTIFPTRAADKDALDKPRQPRIKRLEPQFVLLGADPPPEVKIVGTSFTGETKVTLNGAERETRYLSEEALSITLLAEDVASAGSLTLKLENPGPNGGSASTMLEVKPPEG